MPGLFARKIVCLTFLLTLALPRAVSADEDPRIADLLGQAVVAYKAAVEETKALLTQGQKNVPVPEPPSLELDCNEGIVDLLNGDLVEHYIREASEPENTLLRRLLAARAATRLLSDVPLNQLLATEKARQLMQKNPDDYPDRFTYEMMLLTRLKEKVRKLLAAYPGKPDKLLAISAFACVVNRSMALLGEMDEQLFAELARWEVNILNVLMQKLVKEHDYGQVEPILKVLRFATLTGSDDPAVLDFYERLRSALTFRLEATYSLDREKEWRWITKSQFPLVWVVPEKEKTAQAGAGDDDAAKAEAEAAKAARAGEQARDASARAAFDDAFGAGKDAVGADGTQSKAAGESGSGSASNPGPASDADVAERERLARAALEEPPAATALWEQTKEDIAAALKEKPTFAVAGSGEAKAAFTHKTVKDAKGRAPNFTVLARIENLDACNGTATVILDGFAPDSETYTHCGESKGAALLSAFWTALFAPNRAGGVYSFPVTLNNRSATAISQTIHGGTEGPVTGEFAIKLIHNPGK
jgi:hypothetical protein